MYCYKCGNKLNDDVRFCSNCGAQLNKGKDVEEKSVSRSYDDYDREALKIYLNNLLHLVYAANTLIGEENRIYDAYNEYKNKRIYCKYQVLDETKDHVYPNYYIHLFYDGKKYYTASNQWGFVYTEGILRPDHYFLKEIEEWETTLKKPEMWGVVSGGIFYPKSKARKAIKHFYEYYQEFQKVAPGLYKNNVDIANRHRNTLCILKRETDKAIELRNKAYSLNIVPKQFRNIHAIYYLNEYMHTSRESFSSALLHLDLDQIKLKLDTIIYNQEQQIMHLALLESSNKQLLAQNQATLKRLENIEHNTQNAATYAEIASVNAKTCAWFSCADYLRKYYGI